MEEFLDSFLNEAKEIINKIEALLFEAEQDTTSPSSKTIEEIFRGMHTLKGVSGMYGYHNTGKLTHELETVYDLIRNENLSFDKDIIELTLNAVDILRCLLKNSDVSCEEDFNNFLDRISKYSESSPESTPDTSTDKEESVNKNTEQNLFFAFYMPTPDVFNRGMNPEYIIDDLKELGIYNLTVHDNGIPIDQQFKQKECNAIWEFYIVTNENLSELSDIFMFSHESEREFGVLQTKNISEDATFIKALKKIYTNKEIDFNRISNIIKDLSPKNSENNTLPNYQEEDVLDEEQQKEDTPKTNLNKKKQKDDSGVKVSSNKLDVMMNLVSDFVITFAELQNISLTIEHNKLLNVTEKFEKLSKKFRDNVISMRLVPLTTMFQQLQRLVRDLSKELNKQVNFIADGLDTELDKTIIAALENPLMHIIRNSIDHGLETPEERIAINKSPEGYLKFTSYYSGSHVIIQVQDDGRGINLEKVKETAIKKGLINKRDNLTEDELVNLILQPGFSTANEISMISGRGVGMDVVKQEISQMRGELEINTEQGLGTIITIKLPLTLSIVDTLHIQSSNMQFLLPLSEIEQCFFESNENLINNAAKQLEYKDILVPYISLREIFKLNSEVPKNHQVIIINKNDMKIAVITDQIIGEYQAVLKPLGKYFGDKQFLSGGSILGDGKLAYVIDTLQLTKLYQKISLEN